MIALGLVLMIALCIVVYVVGMWIVSFVLGMSNHATCDEMTELEWLSVALWPISLIVSPIIFVLGFSCKLICSVIPAKAQIAKVASTISNPFALGKRVGRHFFDKRK